MIVIACVDDGMGMAFNHRRQSMDREVRGRILTLAAGKTLWMSPYSARQFGSAPEIRVDEACTVRAPQGAFCFCETDALPEVTTVEQIVLYRWHRAYPADTFFTLPLNAFRLIRSEDFSGHSHPIITEEIYIK